MKTLILPDWSEIPLNYTGHVRIHNTSTYIWFKDGELHREDGPAIITASTKQWYKKGQRHREDGPAIIMANGRQDWCLDGYYYEKDDYYKELYKRGIITEQELFLELL